MSILTELRCWGAEVSLRADGQLSIRGADPSMIEAAKREKPAIIRELEAELREREAKEAEARCIQLNAMPWATLQICGMLGVIQVCRPRSLEAGDMSDQLCNLAQSFIAACRDHEEHGRRWFVKHEKQMAMYLRVCMPEAYPDLLSGVALDRYVRQIFAPERRTVQNAPMPVAPGQETLGLGWGN